ncbi:endonuclease/exonuclease/phosphatase family protein [Streptomyces sp. SP18CS02]|uniref:endonuclease/exonuclease/phosphatase family protein n=1 Tax=Streptomyces sp. SP18CS02 TaxID=3002531 RepID=UPI002E774B25|nr:endonuclease/exonuclease/phosphatase family protein [Streptomyces sp. SP18CS02]MEE1751348.1 endonuclease/exonuclease/phosphatase family protein [Streptomyces sp. SP18CS02]
MRTAQDPRLPRTGPRTWRRGAAWAAGPLLAGPTVVAVCRTGGTDAITPVPQLLSFLPWLTVPAGLALLLALAARRPLLIAWAAVALAVTGWYAQPYGPDRTRAHGPVVAQLRVLAANVEFGRAAPELLDAIRRERPALVFVSECDPGCADVLTDALRAGHPHRADAPEAGPAGSLILSSHPLTGEPALTGTLGMPGATARIAGKDVRLQLAHPMPPVPGQVDVWKRELGRVAAFAAGHAGGPTLLAGDFNASQDHAAFRAVLDSGSLHDAARLGGAARTPSWPQGGPVPPYVQIDHVLVSEDFSVRGARFLPLPRTDHRALLVDLDLHGGP